MANSAKVSIELQGVQETIANLKALGPRIYKRVMRGAISKATRPIVKAAKGLCPKETGALKKSIGFVVRTYPAKGSQGGTILAVIGPRTGYETPDPHGGRPRVPVHYAHLVEFGHRIAKGGKLAREGQAITAGQGVASGFVAARPFMRPAFDANKDAALAVIASALAEGLEREAAKRGGS